MSSQSVSWELPFHTKALLGKSLTAYWCQRSICVCVYVCELRQRTMLLFLSPPNSQSSFWGGGCEVGGGKADSDFSLCPQLSPLTAESEIRFAPANRPTTIFLCNSSWSTGKMTASFFRRGPSGSHGAPPVTFIHTSWFGEVIWTRLCCFYWNVSTLTTHCAWLVNKWISFSVWGMEKEIWSVQL